MSVCDLFIQVFLSSHVHSRLMIHFHSFVRISATTTRQANRTGKQNQNHPNDVVSSPFSLRFCFHFPIDKGREVAS